MNGTDAEILDDNYSDGIEYSLELRDKLKNLPKNPGCYLYKNDSGKVIYVGKAINLRNRVRSYFQQGKPHDAKTNALLKKISDLEIIVTDSEAEALILEDTLIKQYKPRYNILLRDDKSYPYIRVTKEEFPRIFITRKIIRDGSKYFGPFTEVRYLRQMIKIIRTVFQIRSCELKLSKESIEKEKFRVCLDYHIGKCKAPCINKQSEAEYNENVHNAIQVINGKTRELEKYFENKMTELSDDMRFEEAMIVKNKYLLLKDFSNNQKIVTSEAIDRDVFGFARLDDVACSLIFKIRDGKLTGKRHFILTNSLELSDSAIIQSTIEKWYMETEFVPKEILLPCEPGESEFILDWLKKKRERTLEITIPKLGDKKKIVNLASANAEFQIREYLLAISKRDQTTPKILLSLQRDLRLEKIPRRIECFDNSHIQGSELVSSMVVFTDGKANKSEYRKFKNRTVEGNDDFAAMKEVVSRRYSRMIAENSEQPDLIIIDGGKGQLSSAVEVLKELGLFGKISIIGLAKRLEEVFFPGSSESVLLPRTSSSLRLIQQLRDEAHRFAITYHRKLREKRTLQTELVNIDGIGEKTASKLLTKFGSVQNIKKAERQELEVVLTKNQIEKLESYFTSDDE